MATEKKMRVWMTKYALTSGIKHVWVTPPSALDGNDYVYTIPKGEYEYRTQLKLSVTAFVKWQDAFGNAEVQRQRKIKSLEKKLAELRKMKFSGTP